MIPTDELRFLDYLDVKDPEFTGRGGHHKAMIMPGFTKNFFMPSAFGEKEWEDFWDCLWASAAKALAMASEVYVLGYSMPNNRWRARDLLIRSTNREAEISVVSLADSMSIALELRSAGIKNVRAITDQPFEIWVRSSRKRNSVTLARPPNGG